MFLSHEGSLVISFFGKVSSGNGCFRIIPTVLMSTRVPVMWIQGAVLISWWHLTSIGIPMLKTRRFHDRLIYNMGIPYICSEPSTEKNICTETGPWLQCWVSMRYKHGPSHDPHIPPSLFLTSGPNNVLAEYRSTCQKNFLCLGGRLFIIQAISEGLIFVWQQHCVLCDCI